MIKMIFVLRLGHRFQRDERLSTHCGLIARALGADGIIYSGEHDQSLLDSIEKAKKNWGGSFEVSYNRNFRSVIKDFKSKNFTIIHLTMFGMPIQDKITEIRKSRDMLIVLGSEKVPGEIYKMADFNIAIGSQPHSEAAALAITLHEYFQGKELAKDFGDANIKVIPQERGKKTIKKEGV